MMNYLYYLMIDLAIKNGHRFNSVISVPNRPGQFDRFKATRYYIYSSFVAIEDCTSHISCIKDYKSQKNCTAEERAENIRNAFVVNKNLDGKDIILIDDVITTGATVVEISKLLREHHARSICIFTLAVNQLLNLNFIQSFKNIKCNSCEGELILKSNSKTGELFFGYSRFDQCTQTCSLEEGIEKIREINQFKPIDIQFDFEY